MSKGGKLGNVLNERKKRGRVLIRGNWERKGRKKKNPKQHSLIKPFTLSRI